MTEPVHATDPVVQYRDTTRVLREFVKVLPGNTGYSIRETKVKIAGNKVTDIVFDPRMNGLGWVFVETDKGCKCAPKDFLAKASV